MPARNLVQSVMRSVAAFQDASDEVDEAAARRLGINRTDLRCLGHLTRGEGITAGQLAEASGLSPGAATTAVDRLIRAGYAERVRDENDRRLVRVRPTSRAVDEVSRIWGPIGRDSQAWLSRKSTRELELILDFLQNGLDFQAKHADRIRKSPKAE
jgi:DNA-binding MarR family transcriptional regulator